MNKKLWFRTDFLDESIDYKTNKLQQSNFTLSVERSSEDKIGKAQELYLWQILEGDSSVDKGFTKGLITLMNEYMDFKKWT